MLAFLTRKKIIAKTVYILFMMSLLLTGVYLFSVQRDFLQNYKPYYFKSLLDSQLIKYKYGDNISDEGKTKAKSIPVLLYHGIVYDKKNPNDDESITLKSFESQMIGLKEKGYQTVTFDDFSRFMKGEKQLPERSFLLTFDDGRKDTYYPADPILKSLNFNAVMFAIAGRPEDDKFHLSTKEYKAMIESGRWEINSHGWEDHGLYKIDAEGNQGHFLSNRLWLDSENRLENDNEFQTRIEKDLSTSKVILKDKLGVEAKGFAFPFGDFRQHDAEVPEKLKPILLSSVQKIFPFAFYQVWINSGSSLNSPDPNTFMIKRIEPKSDWTTETLVNGLEKAKAKELVFEDTFQGGGDGSWINVWGKIIRSDNTLTITTNNTMGGTAFLDGSSWWKDYEYKSKIDWVKGSNLLILGRYYDNENFLAINISSDRLRIEQRVDGKTEILTELKDNFTHGMLEPTIIFKGEEIDVKLGSISANTKITNDRLRSGGVGLMVWDQKQNNAEARLLEVKIKNVD